MANQDLKREFNHFISEDRVFTDLDKQKIRNKIKHLQQKPKQNKTHLFPKVLTGLVVAGMMVVIGGVVANQTGLMDTDLYQQGAGEVIKDNEKQPDIKAEPLDAKRFDPLTIQNGDQVGELTLNYIGPKSEVSKYPDGEFYAVFNGEIEITGSLEHLREDDPYSPNKLVFRPTSDEWERLPLPKNFMNEMYITFDNNEQLVMNLGTKPGSYENQITLNISGYTMHYVSGDFSSAEATYNYTVVEDGASSGVDHTGVLSEIEPDSFAFNKKLASTYGQFSKTYDEKLLLYHSPLEIYKLYYNAEVEGDVEMQFYLLNEDSETQPYKTLKAFKESKEQYSVHPEGNVDSVRYSQTEEHITSENTAYVLIKTQTWDLRLDLSKNNEGIWKIERLPGQ